MLQKKVLTSVVMLSLAVIFIASSSQEKMHRLELLFLGHKNNRNHNSERLADILTGEYFKKGINISFTNEPGDLNEENLRKYDGLIVYANHDTISRSQEKALLEFVRSGKG